MELIIEMARQHETLNLVWRAIVWLSAAFLIVNGVVALVAPQLAARFLEGFVHSQQLNFLEASLRLIAGVPFIGASPTMHPSALFCLLGAILAATSIPMMFLYQAHKRYAAWAIPFVKRILPLYGLLSSALGGLLFYGML